MPRHGPLLEGYVPLRAGRVGSRGLGSLLFPGKGLHPAGHLSAIFQVQVVRLVGVGLCLRNPSL